jgi:hypothetical protein
MNSRMVCMPGKARFGNVLDAACPPARSRPRWPKTVNAWRRTGFPPARPAGSGGPAARLVIAVGGADGMASSASSRSALASTLAASRAAGRPSRRPCGRFRSPAGAAPAGPGGAASCRPPAAPCAKSRRHGWRSRCRPRHAVGHGGATSVSSCSTCLTSEPEPNWCVGSTHRCRLHRHWPGSPPASRAAPRVDGTGGLALAKALARAGHGAHEGPGHELGVQFPAHANGPRSMRRCVVARRAAAGGGRAAARPHGRGWPRAGGVGTP